MIDEKDNPRILQFVASSRGGGATYCRDLAIGLQDSGYALDVLMPEDGGHVDAEDMSSRGITHVAWDGSVRQVKDRAVESTVLHCHGARAACWGRLACRNLGAKRPKLVYQIHGFMIPHYPFLKRALLGLQERLMKKQVDLFLAVSEAEKKAWCDYGLATEDQVKVLYYGLDPMLYENPERYPRDIRKELGVGGDDLVMTQVARFFWPRDFHTLLRAFDAAASDAKNLKLVLVGDGPWMPRVQSILSDMRHADRVVLPGARNDATNVFHASDIAVLSSAGGDGFPIANLEAMACGKPVLTADCDGMPEQVVPGQTGFLYPVGDSDALADRIIELASNEHTRVEMGRKGRERVEHAFHRATMLERAHRIYRELLES